MLKRWLVYSILSVVLGLNVYFILENLISLTLLVIMLALSVIFFVFGMIKKDKYA